jgi:apolipoprotein N-acyltransferase
MLGTALLCVPYLGPLLAWVALLPLLRAWRQAHGSGRLFAASALSMALAQSIALGYFAPLNPLAVAVLLLVQSAVASLPWLLLALLRQRLPTSGPRLLWLLPGLWLSNDWLWAGVPQIVPTPLGGALGPWLPAIQFYQWTGLSGGTLLLLLLQVALVQAPYPRRQRLLTAASVALLVNALGGWLLWRASDEEGHEAQSGGETVALIRAGAYRPGDDLYPFFDRLLILSAQAARAGAQLLVWPEAALPAELTADPQGPLNRALHALPARSGVPLLFGYDEGAGRFLYNSAGLLPVAAPRQAGDIEQRYRKRWLLPAEEGRYLFGLGKQHMLGGDSSQPLGYRTQQGASRAIGPLICYEVLIPAAAVAQVRAGAQALLVLANDQDFWRSPARWQLDAQSRVRAVETRRSLLRAASTGALYQLDAYGRQVAQEDSGTPTFLLARPDWHHQLSLYVRYPDWLPLLVMLDTLIAIFLLCLAGRRPRSEPLANSLPTLPAER